MRHRVYAYPTESCYGLGCNPDSRLAVRQILRLKRRPQSKGLILIASRPEQLVRYVTTEALQAAVASGYWPGPVTLLLTASKRCPVWLRGKHQTIAVRVTAHVVAAKLCQRLGMAMVSTSANRSGQRALRSARGVYRVFGQQVQVMPGCIGQAKRPSKIVDLVTKQVVRS
ncbi:L-threonylcarbamoyladenylate synthase [Sulfuriferula nivalis]|uniref:L-threonylcarbamoyladenylate synthase n=1 Tax=Sulfuriferula nivalis TaxID=2675298 RepID=UPI001E3E34CD|nr:L-threonylcarbamoyladenylate synthase [Sulfuriferula nivalis]